MSLGNRVWDSPTSVPLPNRLHTVEMPNEDYDRLHALPSTVMATFTCLDAAHDYADIYGGVVKPNALSLNPLVPNHPRGTRPYRLVFNSYTADLEAMKETYRDHYVFGEIDVDRDICEDRGFGPILKKRHHSGAIQHHQERITIKVGEVLSVRVWATSRGDAKKQFTPLYTKYLQKLQDERS